MIDAKALAVAVELELPDALAGGPRTAEELAAEVDGDADAIDRLLRFLVSRGFFRRDRRGRYRSNAASDGLRRDAGVGCAQLGPVLRQRVALADLERGGALVPHRRERVRARDRDTSSSTT